MQNIKKIEKVVIVLIVLYIISWVGDSFLSVIMHKVISTQEQIALSVNAKYMSYLRNFIEILLKIGISFWMFILAKKDGRSKWIWCLFGLTFSLGAALLYYILKIMEIIEKKNE